jgi:hypothetical protein
MTRLWQNGATIQVRVDELGVPDSFTWQGRKHPVTRIVRTWIADDQWWRKRIWREYFKLTTKSQMLVIVYHDLVSDLWFLQRLYD